MCLNMTSRYPPIGAMSLSATGMLNLLRKYLSSSSLSFFCEWVIFLPSPASPNPACPSLSCWRWSLRGASAATGLLLHPLADGLDDLLVGGRGRGLEWFAVDEHPVRVPD